MPRSRSSSSDSSRHKSKKSKKKRSRDSSYDRGSSSRRDRSSSRERKRKSHKKSSSRRRSRSSSRSRSSRRRSKSRSRSRSRSKSSKRRKHYSSSSKSKSKSRSVSPVTGPKIQIDDKPQTEVDVVRRNRAIEAIENSGFEQKSFESTAIAGGLNIPLPNEDFEFGTSAEKSSYDQATRVIEQLECEGLCHPDWRPSDDRNAKWLRYLTQLRKKIVNRQ